MAHHTANDKSIQTNEDREIKKGHAALAYHFFIDKSGQVFEGRPLEVMGSHAGEGKERGVVLADPDWGAVGIAARQLPTERSPEPPEVEQST